MLSAYAIRHRELGNIHSALLLFLFRFLQITGQGKARPGKVALLLLMVLAMRVVSFLHKTILIHKFLPCCISNSSR